MNEADRDIYLKEMAAAAERTANALERIERDNQEGKELQRLLLISIKDELKTITLNVSWVALGVIFLGGLLWYKLG